MGGLKLSEAAQADIGAGKAGLRTMAGFAAVDRGSSGLREAKKDDEEAAEEKDAAVALGEAGQQAAAVGEAGQ